MTTGGATDLGASLSSEEMAALLAAGNASTEPTPPQADAAGFVVDACDAVLSSTPDERYRNLALAIREAGAENVAIATREDPSQHAIVASVPAPLSRDGQADLAAAADEAAILGDIVAIPSESRLDRPARRAIELAAASLGCHSLLAVPVDDETETRLVLLIGSPSPRLVELAPLLSPSLAYAVRTREEAERSSLDRLRKSIADRLTASRRRIAAGCLFAAGAILSLPLPYRAACDCVLEPQTRRFVAAPFEGRLDVVDVRPGEIVTAGQRLALMDNSEIEYELEGLLAEQEKSRRERTSQLARRRVSEAQIATLETERIEARLDVLKERQSRLAVTAPIDGLVVEGDLDRVRGMPLETGRTLFEIAPLDRLVCEIHVPQYDYAEVRAGQRVGITLDSQPWDRLTGTVLHVRPRVELRGDYPVLIAEVELENPGPLRPGMTGQARITTDWHPIAWNWFHRWYGEFRRGW